jgi:hypothetical protein
MSKFLKMAICLLKPTNWHNCYMLTVEDKRPLLLSERYLPEATPLKRLNM